MTPSLLVNGVTPADADRAIAVNDRGFQYGDGVFETLLLIDGRVRYLEDHLQRLARGCEQLGIRAPDGDALRADIHRVTESAQRCIIKVIVSRGAGGRGYRPQSDLQSTRVVATYPSPGSTDDTGVTLRWCETRLARNARLAGIKHLNRLEQVLAQSEWNEAEFDEGLMLDSEGELVSGTASNVFVVRDGMLVTPDLRYSGVRGVMRARVLRAAQQLGLVTSEEPLWPHDVESASEVFITNAVRGIRSVAMLGQQRWDDDRVARKLRAALEL